MDKSIFQAKPKDDKCTCIICRKNNVVRSDEHIIPMSLGGYMHTWNVCKSCNSKLGQNVDPLLTNHYLIRWERYFHKLKGESGKDVPNPLIGTRTAEDGEKYRVADDGGIITPHVIQKFSIAPDGKTVKLTIDPKDKDKADEMMRKYCERKGLKYNPQSISKSGTQKSPSPAFNIEIALDISHFRMGVLKIAYEFTCCLIPNYFKDALAVRISDILLKASVKRLDELQISSAFRDDIFPEIFGSVIDFTKKNRHYIFLTNLDGRLYCFVKLFDVFCIGVKMSDSTYQEANRQVIVINDFSSCDFNLYTLEELIAASQQYVETGYVFPQQWQEKLEQLSANQQIGFYASNDGSNLCFDDNYNCIGSVVKYLHSLPPDYGSLEQKDNKVISTIPAHSKLFFKMAPSNEFVPVEEIKLISEVTKI